MPQHPAPPKPEETASPEPLGAVGVAPPAEEERQDAPSSPRGTLQGRWRVLSRMPIIMMLASLLLGLGIVQLTFQLGNSVYRSVTWQKETVATRARVKALQDDVKILEDAERWASDPTYLEQLARCQGYVGRNETVVVATSASTDPGGESCTPVRLP